MFASFHLAEMVFLVLIEEHSELIDVYFLVCSIVAAALHLLDVHVRVLEIDLEMVMEFF